MKDNSVPYTFQKLDHKVDWGSKLDLIATEIRDMCDIYTEKHKKECERMEWFYNYLSYCSLILTPLTGTIIVINDRLDISDTVFTITTASLSFVTSILSTIVKFKNYEETILKHKHAISRYTSLQRNISKQLLLPYEARFSPIPYLDWVEIEFETIFQNAPSISIERQHSKCQVSSETENDTDDVKAIPLIDTALNVDGSYDKMMQYELRRMRLMSESRLYSQ